MGCCVGKEEENGIERKQSIKRAEHKLGADVNGIHIEILKADILKQPVDAFVIGTDLYLRNRNSFHMTENEQKIIQKTFENARNPSGSQENNNPAPEMAMAGATTQQRTIPYGEALDSQLDLGQKNTIKGIISVSLPLWKGGERGELSYLEKGIKNMFIEAQRYESIGFTDIASTLFGFPKQEVARVFAQCLKQWLDNKSGLNKLNKILVVLRDDQTIYQFQKYLMEENIASKTQNQDSSEQQVVRQYSQHSLPDKQAQNILEEDAGKQLKQNLLDDNEREEARENAPKENYQP